MLVLWEVLNFLFWFGQLFVMKHILMFIFATGVTVDSILLWLSLLTCLSLATKVSFAKMFTSVTRVHMVPMVTFATIITNVTELPVATMVNDNHHGYIPTKITSFVTTTKPEIGLSL